MYWRNKLVYVFVSSISWVHVVWIPTGLSHAVNNSSSPSAIFRCRSIVGPDKCVTWKQIAVVSDTRTVFLVGSCNCSGWWWWWFAYGPLRTWSLFIGHSQCFQKFLTNTHYKLPYIPISRRKFNTISYGEYSPTHFIIAKSPRTLDCNRARLSSTRPTHSRSMCRTDRAASAHHRHGDCRASMPTKRYPWVALVCPNLSRLIITSSFRWALCRHHLPGDGLIVLKPLRDSLHLSPHLSYILLLIIDIQSV